LMNMGLGCGLSMIVAGFAHSCGLVGQLARQLAMPEQARAIGVGRTAHGQCQPSSRVESFRPCRCTTGRYSTKSSGDDQPPRVIQLEPVFRCFIRIIAGYESGANSARPRCLQQEQALRADSRTQFVESMRAETGEDGIPYFDPLDLQQRQASVTLRPILRRSSGTPNRAEMSV
jgi:hypothetical protein